MAHDWNTAFEDYLAKEKTLACMMLNRAEHFPGLTALRYMEDGEWKSITWGEFGHQIRRIALALLEMEVQTGDMVAIFSRNRPEWAIADLGVLAIRGVTVPVYATNSADETAYIVDDAGVQIMFVGDQDQYDKAFSLLGKTKNLKRIIAFDRHIVIQGTESRYFDELLASGSHSGKTAEFDKRLAEVHPDDILTLIYTSGTTGNPKGAVHTHKSFMAGIFPAISRFPEAKPSQVSLAILPLSHVFERMWSYGCMSMYAQIAYCPDPKQFVQVMNAIHPHYLTSVPRIWEKVYGTLNEMIKGASPLKARLFQWAMAAGRERYRLRSAGKPVGLGLKCRHALADAIVLGAIRKKLGCDRNIVYHVGGAAFAAEINEFFQAIGINIIQGFGLTEFFPVAVGYGDKGRIGACGPIMPMVEVRIDDEGEIQLKGGMAMKEYYRNPKATAEIFTADGWFRTGDVGRIEGDEEKYIVITDRIKDLIITAGGKNISPQQIELLLGDELMIEQFVVVGEGRRYVTALVVPWYQMLEDYAKKNNIPFSSREDLATNPTVIKLYEEIVEERTKSLGQVEKIKKIALLTNELTQEAGELTPTLKKKRKVIEKKYADIIDKMYEE